MGKINLVKVSDGSGESIFSRIKGWRFTLYARLVLVRVYVLLPITVCARIADSFSALDFAANE